MRGDDDNEALPGMEKPTNGMKVGWEEEKPGGV
jgi:hypothetical protein